MSRIILVGCGKTKALAAQAVGEALLESLLAADAGQTFKLSPTDIWVREHLFAEALP